MIARALAAAVERLAGTSASPRLDAELLFAHAVGIERGALRAREQAPLGAAAASDFAALVERRAGGEPIAYILGRREFWTLTLEVGPPVLVPRPETELLVEWSLEQLRGWRAPAVLDLGTGSGALGLALASERADARLDLVDVSATALELAERNRARLGLGNARTLCGDWYAPVAGARYALIVSNPPYLGADDPQLDSAELGHEPRSALLAGPTGLEALAAVVRAAPRHLEPGGAVIVEHGAAQGEAVRALMAAAGLTAIVTRRDLAALERATLGTRRA
jgi:release factor glutamine methyltransferase